VQTMPDIPEGATVPQDHQSAFVKPEVHSDGWELLRPPIDLELWEITDFLALASAVKVRGTTVDLTNSTIKLIGQMTKILQLEFALSSVEFKTALKAQGDFPAQVSWIVPLALEYAGALGEAVGSAS
jgi:hypothetical protein